MPSTALSWCDLTAQVSLSLSFELQLETVLLSVNPPS